MTDEEIHDCIAAMWDSLYGGDLDERERAEAVYSCHSAISFDLYIDVWAQLDSKFRSAWKGWVAQERAFRGQIQRDIRREGR